MKRYCLALSDFKSNDFAHRQDKSYFFFYVRILLQKAMPGSALDLPSMKLLEVMILIWDSFFDSDFCQEKWGLWSDVSNGMAVVERLWAVDFLCLWFLLLPRYKIV